MFSTARLRLLVVVILAVPSLWMLATIHPLWRDVDAYVQVTQGFSYATIVQFSALYCFPARMPLALGALFEHKFWRYPELGHHYMARPALTNSGVFLLVLIQHGFLLFAQLTLVRAISRRAAVQIVVALLLAANASFYVFAHSVGAEALCLSGLILLCGLGFKIFQQRQVSRGLWAGYFLALLLCVILRHINGVLPAILPGAMLLLFLLDRGFLPARWRTHRRYFASCGRRVAISIALGVASIALAVLFEHGMCRIAGVPPNSVAGIAFSWRLDFFVRLAPAEREALLTRMRAKTSDPVLHQMLDCIPLGVTADNLWDMEPYAAALRRIPLPPSTDGQSPRDELKKYYNRLASLFIMPPDPDLLSAVWTDYSGAWTTTPVHVAVTPFHTSLYFFPNQDRVKQLSTLNTFNRPNARAEILAESNGPYIRLFAFSYRFATGLWLLLVVLSCRDRAGRRACCFGLALIATGALLEWGNVLFTVFEYRYTLPLWVLLFTALLVQANALYEGARVAVRK